MMTNPPQEERSRARDVSRVELGSSGDEPRFPMIFFRGFHHPPLLLPGKSKQCSRVQSGAVQGMVDGEENEDVRDPHMIERARMIRPEPCFFAEAERR